MPFIVIYKRKPARFEEDTDETRRGPLEDHFSVELDVDIDMSHLEKYRIDHSQLKYFQKIAKGAYGEVWSGELEGQPVAIKMLLIYKREREDVQHFVDEVTLMGRLVLHSEYHFLITGNTCMLTYLIYLSLYQVA